MKIYLFKCDTDAFRTIGMDAEYFEALEQFQEKPLGPNWSPIPVTIKGGKLPMPDVLQIDYRIPVLTKRSLEVLRPHLASNIEQLKLDCTACDLFALNIHVACDCLIEEQSDVRRNRFGNLITINNGVFDEVAVEHHGLFRIPGDGSVYATEAFLEAVDANRMAGLRKREVGSTVRL